MDRQLIGRTVAAGAVLLALVGCTSGSAAPGAPTSAASSAAASAAPVSTPAPATPAPATPATTPTPFPTPLVAGPATIVSGTEVCDTKGGTSSMVQGREQLRDSVLTCTDTMNDQRVTGTVSGTFSYDAWTPAGSAQSIGVEWGTARLRTAGGTWEGRWAGVIYGGLRDDITVWYQGSGAYAGLTYTVHVAGVLGSYQLEGLMYPGEPPSWP